MKERRLKNQLYANDGSMYAINSSGQRDAYQKIFQIVKDILHECRRFSGGLTMNLFRKDIEPRCAYCSKGSVINEREVVCPRKGVVAAEYHCRRFQYDPFKRVPPRPVKLETSKLKEEDFAI